MSAIPPDKTDLHTTPYRTSQPPAAKPQRVLACILCQRRKVKCDRKFPCKNCTKQGAQCVPATQARRRRRRFPERDLLERVRRYEGLMRKAHVKFEPLHKDESSTHELEGSSDSEDDGPQGGESKSHSGGLVGDVSAASTPFNKSESSHDASGAWHDTSPTDTPEANDCDDLKYSIRGLDLKNIWEQCFENSDHILFGSRKLAVNLSTLHPEPVHIFRLWQVYLDNVNPLLKVTHAPTFQGRIIEAASKLTSIDPALEALMFGIYCASIMSLSPEVCHVMFGLSKSDLLLKYQFGCQQALLNHGFLKSSDMDCLTAIFLYLVSASTGTDPRSLSSMLGIAMRMAQRMGINNESENAALPVLEAEMRRRLWWALVLFDMRISELSDYKKTSCLNPTWNCKVPLNINDSDFHAGMKASPVAMPKTSDSVFVAVRSELGEFLRHSPVFIGTSNPTLKPIAKPLPDGGCISALDTLLEENYLRFCDPEIPIQFMTIWMTRGYVSKWLMIEHCEKYTGVPSSQLTDEQRDAGLLHSFRILEADSKIISSPLVQGFAWLQQLYFPFPAYIHIVQDLATRPLGRLARQAWDTMSENFDTRFPLMTMVQNSSLFAIFTSTVLKGWDAFEKVLQQSAQPYTPPSIIVRIKQYQEDMAQRSQGSSESGQTHEFMNLGASGFPMPVNMGYGIPANTAYGAGGPDTFMGSDPRLYLNPLGQMPLTPDGNPLQFTSIDWWLK